MPKVNFEQHVDIDSLFRLSGLKWTRDCEPDMISFGTADSDFPMPPAVKTAIIEALDEEIAFYSVYAGYEEIRALILDKLHQKNRIALDSPDEVLILPGTMMGLYLSCQYALKESSSEAILFDPIYPPFAEEVALAKGKVVWSPVNVDEGFRVDIEDLKAKITPNTKLLMTCNPLNPCGTVFTKAELKAIADLAADHDFFLMTDELYETVIFDGRKHLSIAAIEEARDRTLSIFGFSKGHGMAGLRCGYLAAPQPIMDEIILLFKRIIIHTPTLSQIAVKAAITSAAIDAWAKQFCAHIQWMRDLAWERLNAIEGVRCHKPEGTLFVFPHFDVGMTSDAFNEHLKTKGRVILASGSHFGPNGEGFQRLCLATSAEMLNEGLNRIEKSVNGLLLKK